MKQEIQIPPSARPDVDAPAIEVTYSESDALCQELAEQKDLTLRLAADFENFKRRSRQEVESRAAAQKESLSVSCCPPSTTLNGLWHQAPPLDLYNFTRVWR